MIRTSLINSLMEFLEDNKHEDLPQKIFEIGDVLYMDETQETKVRASKKLAGLICHSSANFTEIKSVVTSLLQNLGYSMEISDSDNSSFIAGRVSDVKGTSANGNVSGFFGEFSPEVITNFTLDYPVIGLKLNLTHRNNSIFLISLFNFILSEDLKINQFHKKQFFQLLSNLDN